MDLVKFEALFKRFGVYKFDHLADVQVEDLHKFCNFKLVLNLVSTLVLIIFKLGVFFFSRCSTTELFLDTAICSKTTLI